MNPKNPQSKLSEILSSRAKYEQFLYTIIDIFPEIEKSTLHFFTTSATAGILKRSLWFHNGLELRVVEVIDFAFKEILDYSYTICKEKVKLQWYDPQPHPNDPDLAETFPHHVHEPPDIKYNRKPVHYIAFDKPNLPVLIKQIATSMK